MLYASVPYVLRSWQIGEASFEAGGLPAIYLLKTLLPIAALLLLLQGLIMLAQGWRETEATDTKDTSGGNLND